jgi:hypothetical protein
MAARAPQSMNFAFGHEAAFVYESACGSTARPPAVGTTAGVSK